MDLVPIITSAGRMAASSEAATSLSKAFGSTLAEAWQAIVGDRIAAWRIANAAAISEKLSKKLEKRNLKIDSNKIPPKYAFTWFEEASKQDKPEIQEIFATLLSNAAEGNADALLERNLEIVSRLTPESAIIVDIISNNITKSAMLFEELSQNFKFDMTERRFLETILEHRDEEFLTAYEDVIRIGIVERYLTLDTSALEDKITDIKSAIDRMSSYEIRDFTWNDLVEANYNITLSRLGWSLCRALYPQKFGQFGAG